MPDSPAIVLVDNGSVQAGSTLNLRALASALATRAGRPVLPVSLLHSSGVDPALLGGVPAEILEPALRRLFAGGVRTVVLVPLFFGPSAALTSYIPGRLQALAPSTPGLEVRIAPPVVDPAAPGDHRIAAILADHVRTMIRDWKLDRPSVIMVDHGSPQRAVGEVRAAIARQLAEQLGSVADRVIAASMERRDGPEFDFNEPLLARALEQVSGNVIVAPLFFSPGRHAGPGGDIERICRDAEATRPGLRVHLAPLVGTHPALIDLLAERVQSILTTRFSSRRDMTGAR